MEAPSDDVLAFVGAMFEQDEVIDDDLIRAVVEESDSLSAAVDTLFELLSSGITETVVEDDLVGAETEDGDEPEANDGDDSAAADDSLKSSRRRQQNRLDLRVVLPGPEGVMSVPESPEVDSLRTLFPAVDAAFLSLLLEEAGGSVEAVADDLMTSLADYTTMLSPRSAASSASGVGSTFGGWSGTTDAVVGGDDGGGGNGSLEDLSTGAGAQLYMLFPDVAPDQLDQVVVACDYDLEAATRQLLDHVGAMLEDDYFEAPGGTSPGPSAAARDASDLEAASPGVVLLCEMFPDVDPSVAAMVLADFDGNADAAIHALTTMADEAMARKLQEEEAAAGPAPMSPDVRAAVRGSKWGTFTRGTVSNPVPVSIVERRRRELQKLRARADGPEDGDEFFSGSGEPIATVDTPPFTPGEEFPTLAAATATGGSGKSGRRQDFGGGGGGRNAWGVAGGGSGGRGNLHGNAWDRDLAVRLRYGKLRAMYPSVDRNLLDTVFAAHEFRLGRAMVALDDMFPGRRVGEMAPAEARRPMVDPSRVAPPGRVTPKRPKRTRFIITDVVPRNRQRGSDGGASRGALMDEAHRCGDLRNVYYREAAKVGTGVSFDFLVRLGKKGGLRGNAYQLGA